MSSLFFWVWVLISSFIMTAFFLRKEIWHAWKKMFNKWEDKFDTCNFTSNTPQACKSYQLQFYSRQKTSTWVRGGFWGFEKAEIWIMQKLLQLNNSLCFFVNWVWNANWLILRYPWPLQVIVLNELTNGNESQISSVFIFNYLSIH